MARTKALFFIIALAWIFLVTASRGLLKIPDPDRLTRTHSLTDEMAKTLSYPRNPAQISIQSADKILTPPTLQWSIEPITGDDHSLLKK